MARPKEPVGKTLASPLFLVACERTLCPGKCQIVRARPGRTVIGRQMASCPSANRIEARDGRRRDSTCDRGTAKEQRAALGAWLAARDQAEWDDENERDFAPGGALLEETNADARAGMSSRQQFWQTRLDGLLESGGRLSAIRASYSLV